MGTIGKRGLQVRHAGVAPEQTIPFPNHGHADMHQLGTGGAMHAVFEPGWRWSRDMAEAAGTSSCQLAHLGYVLSGRMKIVMDDGTEAEIGPGDLVEIAPGHDAWVLGDEPCELLDFRGYDSFMKEMARASAGAPRSGAAAK